MLSPVLFAVYVNSVIETLRRSGYGCYVGSLFVACIIYADHLLLVSASSHKFQLMVDICCSNASKSQAIRIRGQCRTDIILNGCAVWFVDELKYIRW